MRWMIALFLFCVTAFVQADDAKRDPWVFRCVLDERARVIVAQLHPHFFAAYDAQSCSLFKAWIGDINLTGSVYDTKHGPQPLSIGDIVFKQESLDLWSISKDSKAVEAKRKYVGYKVKDDTFALLYAIELPGDKTVSITETPSISEKDGAYTLSRNYDIKDLPEGYVVSLQNAGAVEGAVVKADGAELKDNVLTFSKSGQAVLTATFSTKK